jgi:hypothetical protein
MSSETEEERKEYVERDEPAIAPGTSVVAPATTGTVVRETVVREPGTVVSTNTPVVAAVPPESERRESVVRKTNTNFGAIIAMIIGAAILMLGIFLIFTKVFPYLAYPWSLLAVLLVAIVMIAVGGSLLQTRTSRV